MGKVYKNALVRQTSSLTRPCDAPPRSMLGRVLQDWDIDPLLPFILVSPLPHRWGKGSREGESVGEANCKVSWWEERRGTDELRNLTHQYGEEAKQARRKAPRRESLERTLRRTAVSRIP